eukprot:SAG22_NODE_237_length_14221_cov_37.207832_9_plen_95_part_00
MFLEPAYIICHYIICHTGCVTEAPGTPTGAAAVFAPNVWRNDVMVPLSLTENFIYRQAWGSQASGNYDWDKSQVRKGVMHSLSSLVLSLPRFVV